MIVTFKIYYCSFIHTTKTTRILLCIKHPENLKIFAYTDYVSKYVIPKQKQKYLNVPPAL